MIVDAVAGIEDYKRAFHLGIHRFGLVGPERTADSQHSFTANTITIFSLWLRSPDFCPHSDIPRGNTGFDFSGFLCPPALTLAAGI